jgi:hypothetical protein
MRDPIGERFVADVIAQAGGTFASWIYKGVGEIATRSRSALEIFVDDDRAPVVAVLLGSNPGGAAPSSFAAEAREALSLAGKHGAEVVLVGPYANDPGGRRLAVLRSLVPDTIDGTALAAGLPRAADGVHFTEAGYRTLTTRMIEAVMGVVAARRQASTGLPDIATGLPGVAQPGETAAEAGDVPKTEPSSRSRYTVPLVVGGVVVVGGLVAYAVYRSRRRRG